jgi:hypothetical protein
MSTATGQQATQVTDDAAFRSMITTIRDRFTAIGLTKITCTGEVNTSTVTKPSVVSTYAGRMIFAFDDSLQATYPVYIEVSFGVTAHVQQFLIGMRCGTGYVDATASVDNDAPVVSAMFGGSVNGNYTRQYHWNYNSDYGLVMSWADDSASSVYPECVAIERTTTNGASDSRGVMFVAFSNTRYSYVVYSGDATVDSYASNTCTVPITGSGAIGNTIYMFPIRAMTASGEEAPFRTVFGAFRVDLTNQVAVSTSVWYGGTKSVLPFTTALVGARTPVTGPTPANTVDPAILWE